MDSRHEVKQENKTNVIVVTPQDLDFDAIVNHQQLAFSEIIEKTGTRYLFNEAYYRWKYAPPAGNALIAISYDELGMVATNAMYPLDILAGNKKIRGWQSCDTATHPRGRNKGQFMKCIGA